MGSSPFVDHPQIRRAMRDDRRSPASLHEAGVIHRGLNPQNILVSHYPARSAPIHGGKDLRPDKSGHYEHADYISEPFGLPVVEQQCYRSLLCNHWLNLWQSLHLDSELK